MNMPSGLVVIYCVLCFVFLGNTSPAFSESCEERGSMTSTMSVNLAEATASTMSDDSSSTPSTSSTTSSTTSSITSAPVVGRGSSKVSLGIAYSMLNDLSLQVGVAVDSEYTLQFSGSGYMSQQGDETDYRYRTAVEVQINVLREGGMCGYLGIGFQYFRRLNSLYERDFVVDPATPKYRTNAEPFLSIGAKVEVVPRFSISIGALFDSVIVHSPENIYFLFYQPIFYPGFEIGAHFRL